LIVGGVIVNMTRPPMLDAEELRSALDGRLPIDAIATQLSAAGVAANTSAIARVLATEGTDHARRIELESRELERLTALDVPVLQLPFLPGGIDLSSLYELAGLLGRQGVR
jgi:hypothetical protein